MSSTQEIEIFFENLEANLENEIEPHYFDLPRRFRYLIEVIEVLGKQIEVTNTGGEEARLSLHDQNPAYNQLLQKEAHVKEVIEDIVKFQHGSLNNSVETVGDVLKGYSSSRDEVTSLRTSVSEIKTVLTSRKTGQTDLKKLWSTKAELAETLRMINAIELLKDAPMTVQHLTNQHRYLAAVTTLNESVGNMFNIDLVDIEALENTREELMDLKEKLLEGMSDELKDCIAGTRSWQIGGNYGRRGSHSSSIRRGSKSGASRIGDEEDSIYGSEAGASDHRSESGAGSLYNGSQSEVATERSGFRGLPPPSSSQAPRGIQMVLKSHGLSGTGGTNASGQQAVSTSMHSWSMDLSEATEALEASLVDPKGAGSLYIRLLVNGVGALKCEDDTERMLFEGTALQFRSTIIRLKMQHRQSWMQSMASDVVSDGQAGGHTRLSRRYTEGVGAGDVSGGRVGTVGEELNYQKHIIEFTSFVRSMLEKAIMMLRMTLYVIKLLHLSKQQRIQQQEQQQQQQQQQQPQHNVKGGASSGGMSGAVLGGVALTGLDDSGHGISKRGPRSGISVGVAPPVVLKDSIKRSVLKLWEDAQQTIIGELQRHFIEQAVEDMSDTATAPTLTGTSGALRTSLGEEDQNQIEDMLTVCPPSTRLAAPVYKDISAFSDKVSKVFRDEVDSQLDSLTVNKVHMAVQKTLENELMPLIQSEVNAEMRDLQMDSLLFAPSTSGVASAPVDGEAMDVCEAAKRCAAIIQPLYFHWAELPRHKDQVLTILDRIVRGFASTAREELDSLTWKMIAGQPQHRKAVLASLKQDPLLTAYRHSIYDGAGSVEEIFDLIAQQLGVAGGAQTMMGGVAIRQGSIKRFNSADSIGSVDSHVSFSKEFETWNDLWDIHNTAVFKEHQDKISSDFSKLATVASIAHSCDWLVKLVCKLCNASLKKLSLHQSAMGGPTSRRTMSHAVNLDDVHASQQLVSTIQGCAENLERLAEECIAVLRGEMQVVSFYFLRQLVTLQLSNSGGSGGRDGEGKHGNSHQVSSSVVHGNRSHAHGAHHLLDGDSNIVTILNHHLMSIQDAVTSAAYPALLAVAVSPLCELIPSFFMRSVMANSPVENSSIADSSRLLKSVVACQQNLCMLLESSNLEPTTDRRLQDRVTEEFDKLRRFISLLHMRPAPEFQDYLRNHPSDFSRKEYQYAWGYLRFRNGSLRLPPFEEMLKQLQNSSGGSDMSHLFYPPSQSTSSLSVTSGGVGGSRNKQGDGASRRLSMKT